MAFSNRVRLPVRLLRPQWPEERTTFRDAAGNSVTLASSVRKTYEFNTDWLPEGAHEKIAIALAHDNVSLEGEKYFGGVTKNAPYEVTWPTDVPNYPLSTGKTSVEVTPFDANNNNCVTCDQLSQVVLVDDLFPSILNENTNYTIDAIANDSICCYPVVYSITSFNSDYLTSASISTSGIISIHTKSGLVAANGIILVTYRATCGNGGYDEADVIGNINGTLPGCLAPTGVSDSLMLPTSAHFFWTAPSPVPDHYFWQLLTPALVVLQSGYTNSTFVDVAGMTPSTPYKFRVRSQCTGPITNNADASASNYISEDFTTPNNTNTCGNYRIYAFDTGRTSGFLGHITYLDCSGVYRTITLQNYRTVIICALQSAPGAFISITSSDIEHTITYTGLCGGPA